VCWQYQPASGMRHARLGNRYWKSGGIYQRLNPDEAFPRNDATGSAVVCDGSMLAVLGAAKMLYARLGIDGR